MKKKKILAPHSVVYGDFIEKLKYHKERKRSKMDRPNENTEENTESEYFERTTTSLLQRE